MTTGAQLLSQPEDRANAIYTEALFRMFGLVALGVMVYCRLYLGWGRPRGREDYFR